MHSTIPPLLSETILLSPHGVSEFPVQQHSRFGIGMSLQLKIPRPAPRQSHGATADLKILEGNASTGIAESLKSDCGVRYTDLLKQPYMIEHMREYGPEKGYWHPSSDTTKRAEETHKKMTRRALLSKFGRSNPNFVKRFYFDWKLQTWSTKLGKARELKHRRMTPPRPAPASKPMKTNKRDASSTDMQASYPNITLLPLPVNP